MAYHPLDTWHLPRRPFHRSAYWSMLTVAPGGHNVWATAGVYDLRSRAARLTLPAAGVASGRRSAALAGTAELAAIVAAGDGTESSCGAAL